MATKMTKNIGTISLTANEIERVTLPASYGFVWVKNMSDGDIYISLNDEFTAGEDGVIDIPKGECARLQGFDDSFIIPVSDCQAYKQFGNAVTVNVSKAVAQSVKDTLKELGEWVD